MSAVWDADLPPAQKSVALALADHGNDEGYRVYPSVGRVAWKTGLSTRTVERAIAGLVALGVLEPLSGQRGGATSVRYRMHVDRLPAREPYRTPVTESGVERDAPDTLSGEGVTQRRTSPDRVSPDPSVTMNRTTIRVKKTFSSKKKGMISDASGLESYR